VPDEESVTCLGSSCFAVGPGSTETTDLGNTWKLFTVAGGGEALESIACLPSSTTCVGVG
jgi:hypothetical protein